MAVLAKPTLVWPACGAFIALAASGQVRRCFLITGSAAVVTILGLVGAMVWSHGEMLESLRAVAGGGGFTLQELRGHLKYVRPGDVGWAVGGLVLWAFNGRAALKDPYFTSLLVCIPITIILFAGKGIHVNHLVDISTIGALATISSIAHAGAPMTRLTRVVLVLATLFGVAEFAFLDGMLIKHGELERVVAAIKPGTAPILSEDPWIPVLAGERPFVLDAFSLQEMRRSSPLLQKDLLDRVDQCQFRAVVLLGPLERNTEWYAEVHFGSGFAEHLRATYSFAGIVGAHAIYLPNCTSSAATALALAPDLTGETESVTDRLTRPSLIDALVHWLRGR
jgi:hypothetical protein